MKKFLEWAKANNRDLSFLQENKIRTGIRPAYPSGYVRHEYPDAYYYPHSATAALDLQNSEKVKDKAPPNDAP